MDETLLFPSPNWFLVSNLSISNDGWIVYGGPNKSICALEPLNEENGLISGKQGHRAHVAVKAHSEKIVSVDVSPEFPVKRNFLSGSTDGIVKQWTLVKVGNTYKIKNTHTQDIYSKEKEEVACVGYSTGTMAITVSSFGKVVKWDLTSNVCKSYTKFLNKFKPTCMSCSPHIPLNVAVGTKQGIVFVLNLEGSGRVIVKVRAQDDEISSLSWCPQYEVLLEKSQQVIIKKSTATLRMEAIRKEGEKENALEQSGIIKKLPDDSFDETVVEEDDTFDIYRDHETEEFGHKKYEPEDILVKVETEKAVENDYLAECLKLKEEILKRKYEVEPSIESLVQAMDKTHVDNASNTKEPLPEASTSAQKLPVDAIVHVQKHLLASIGKYGTVKIWSKTGKQVATCSVGYSNKHLKVKQVSWPTLLWQRADTLFLVDGRSQLVECNPLKIDSKNKLEYRVVHSLHKRGLYAIQSSAPRAQPAYNSPELAKFYESQDWSVYTTSQDRNIIRYCMKTKKQLAVHNTCGGFLYNIQPCPYDAGKIAVSVGDGAIRVWQSATLADDDTKLYPGKVQSYWQNVQGKVLTVAWHPTQENLLAFGTAESRIGLLNTKGASEKPAKTLYPALSGGIYSLCWGEGMHLYACGGPQLVVYKANVPDEVPRHIDVVVEGESWAVGSAAWTPRGLLVGSKAGAVAVLHPTTYQVMAVAFIFRKMIHMVEWHPQQTSQSSEESPYKDLIAACSLDRKNEIVILEYKDNEEGGKELSTWKKLSGHTMPVLQVAWNPHREELILSTSQDTTVRVWDVASGCCVSSFGGHSQHSMGAAWLAMPQFWRRVASGGGDCCLRLWDYARHPAHAYHKVKHDTTLKNKRPHPEKKEAHVNENTIEKEEESQDSDSQDSSNEGDTQLATKVRSTLRKPLKKYLFPTINKQMTPVQYPAMRKFFQKFVLKEESNDDEPVYDADFINIFGTINEVNEVLDMEMQQLLEADLHESWISLAIFRGQIDSMIEFASQRDMLCPYLVSMAPCVSFKYWKDATQLYIAQLDRFVAKGHEQKIVIQRLYGDAVYRKMTTLLSIHDVKGAVDALVTVRLFKEAYILCRIRYMDSIAEDILYKWAAASNLSNNLRLAAMCYIKLGNLSEAATVLARCYDEETIGLAAELAKFVGRTTFAEQVEKNAQAAKNSCKEETDEMLEELPSKIELLMKEIALKTEQLNGQNDVADVEIVQNGSDKQNGDTKVE